MIFGKTRRQEELEKNIRLADKVGRKRCFAWLPVRIDYSQRVWLEWVWRDRGYFINYDGGRGARRTYIKRYNSLGIRYYLEDDPYSITEKKKVQPLIKRWEEELKEEKRKRYVRD